MTIELPVPSANADSQPYWAAAREDRLVLQKCSDCGAYRFYPRYLCPDCWSENADWVDVSGRGTVHSFTIVARAPLPAFREKVPYVVAIIDLAEGPRMITNIVGDDALGVAIGDPVAVTFETRADGFKLPQFQRALETAQ